jgi:hypothetical protein
MAFIPPPEPEQRFTDGPRWQSQAQRPHWVVAIGLGAMVAVAGVWAVVTTRTGGSQPRIALALAIPLLLVAVSSLLVSGYRIEMQGSSFAVRSTVGNLEIAIIPLDGITHAYETNIERLTWSPEGMHHPHRKAIPVGIGPAVVLRLDDNSHIRIATPEPDAVLSQLKFHNIEVLVAPRAASR